jgi:hypothetical protein
MTEVSEKWYEFSSSVEICGTSRVGVRCGACAFWTLIGIWVHAPYVFRFFLRFLSGLGLGLASCGDG